jgi:serine protease AprX
MDTMTRRMRLTIVVAGLVLLTSNPTAFTAAAQLPQLATLSADLLALLDGGSTLAVPVIVRGARTDVEAAAARLGLPVLRRLDQFVVLLANAEGIKRLREEPGILGISGDLPVIAAMSVADGALAADQTRAGSQWGLQKYPGVTGRGVGVAIVDSGIATHLALANKVVAAVSFVPNDPTPMDRFGHGTHIAGIVAGQGSAATAVTDRYQGGIAPGAHLISVKVLGRDGSGRTSDVIAGLDWVVAHKADYGIRIVNLSLGHPVTEPSLTDPLNAAVVRAVASGILVVASAGNQGKDAEGRQVLGSITSPGNSPHALTAGAINMWDTVARNDDTVTTYSSRGPTKYEFATKPDVVAPGNKIVSLEAAGSFLAQTYPSERVAGNGSNAYRRMSGTSMSAGMVSGAAALILEAAPGLTPRHIKMVLQAGASPMLRDGLVASGAGSVNVWASRRMASDGLTSLLPSTLVSGVDAPAGGEMFIDAGTLIDRMYQQTGIRIFSAVDLLLVWADPSKLPLDYLNLLGLFGEVSVTPGNQIIWGDISQSVADEQIIWGDQIFDSAGQQIIWGDSGSTDGYQIIWGDQHQGP